jgi:hypothetical protein
LLYFAGFYIEHAGRLPAIGRHAGRPLKGEKSAALPDKFELIT